MSTTDGIDHARLIAEINAEVYRRRESGELPADLERELDLVFARFAPVDALGSDLEQLLARAEHATFIDVLGPLASNRPGGALVKRVIRRAISWELRHVAQQVSGFAHTAVRALRVVAERLDEVERAGPGAGGRTVDAARQAAGTLDVDHWAPLIGRLLQEAPGRVLHADAGSGELLDKLMGAGLDTYGVETLESAATAAIERGLDIRPDEVADHLRSLPENALGGLVLSGCVDRSTIGAAVDLADLAAGRLAPEGKVVVLSTDPGSWARGVSPAEADLSGGSPLWAPTWTHLLASRGFQAIEVHDGPVGRRLQLTGEAALDDNFALLNRVLFPNPSYAVSGTRVTV